MSAADYPHTKPIVSVDLAIFALAASGLEVLLTRRNAEPCAGQWALPGGWVHTDEDRDLDAAARRVLAEKTGASTPYLEQLRTFGDASRDPRGWSVSVAYVALADASTIQLRGGANASDLVWRAIAGQGVSEPLAFDHAHILREALTRMRGKVEYSTLPVHLLPKTFTLPELQAVYERILDRAIDKSAFRKRIGEISLVEPVPGAMRRASNRPAQLYRVRRGREMVFFDRTI